jgi:uncharacterized protein involved in exopolysaccharide biosynthesis
MQEPQNKNKYPNDPGDEINFKDLFYVLFDGKWIIFSLTAFLSIVGVVYSLLLPNIYESKALLVRTNPTSTINGALGNYSSFAGLAGISIPSGGYEDNSAKAIQKIRSLSFFENNILTNIYLPDLMAVKSWDPEKNTMAYDDNLYDSSSNKWVRETSDPKRVIPSAQESYGVFLTNHLSLGEDQKTNFITVAVRHQSPFISKEWVELVVDEINNFYRQKDKAESEKAVSYLNQQISMTGLSEIKQVIAQLLQEETKKLTLIEANQYYVFEYIDPPAIMERKAGPNRAIICILFALLGGILSVVWVLIRHYVFSKKSQ